jgi:D-alanyl-lipoteichoic acid acyltransferase DltB (MBOAT superfamily)
MSYVIDVYRKDIRPTRNLVEFATFVSFFPHLVAGPIMRPTTLLPQIQSPRKFNLDQFYQGCYLIFWGLAKKMVVADNLARIVNELFGRWQTIDGGLALLAIYAFAFQIYCDFSGYTDVARGVAKCLGIELALNFNLPYFATSPQDFWGRWHISLSRWLQDYLYIPLGGSRGGTFLTYRNLMLTMIIGGLWHGAAWTFVLWGCYQGLILVGHRLAKPLLAKVAPTSPVDAACWKAVRIIATFHMVCLGWLIFRSTGSPPEVKVGAYSGVEQLVGMLRAIVYRPAVPASAYILPIAITILPLLMVQFAQFASKDLDIVARTPWYVRSVFYTLCFYAIVLGAETGGGQFIYFQF